MPPIDIPQRVRASDTLARARRFEGRVSAKQLPRLSAATAGRDWSLDVELQGQRGESGEDWIRGRVWGTLPLECQRQLHPFDWHCEVDVSWRLVYSEAEAKRVMKVVEPLRVEDDLLPLRDWVEDEVLLALPMMPRCMKGDCVSTQSRG